MGNAMRWSSILIGAGVLAAFFAGCSDVREGVSEKASALPRFPISSEAKAFIREKPLANQTVLQSFGFDNVNRSLYTLQLVSGGQTLPGEPAPLNGAKRAENGDMALTRLDWNGSVTGRMYLKGFGHGVGFGVEPDGRDVYLWTEVDAVSDSSNGWGTRLARFKFENGAVLSNDSPKLAKFELLSKVDRTTCIVDAASRRLTMRYRKNGVFRFAVFDLEDVKKGKFVPLADVPQPSGLGTFQGFTSFGDVLYLLDGNSYNGTISVAPKGNTYLTSVDLKTGEQLDRQLTQAGNELSFREPEGLAVQLPEAASPKKARLCYGFASTVSASDTSKRASIYCLDAGQGK